MGMTVIQRRCWEFMGTTRYKNDVVYSGDETIESAYEKAVEGHDVGVRGMNQIMPESTRIRRIRKIPKILKSVIKKLYFYPFFRKIYRKRH